MGIEDRTVLLYGPKPMPKRKKEDDIISKDLDFNNLEIDKDKEKEKILTKEETELLNKLTKDILEKKISKSDALETLINKIKENKSESKLEYFNVSMKILENKLKELREKGE